GLGWQQRLPRPTVEARAAALRRRDRLDHYGRSFPTWGLEVESGRASLVRSHQPKLAGSSPADTRHSAGLHPPHHYANRTEGHGAARPPHVPPKDQSQRSRIQTTETSSSTHLPAVELFVLSTDRTAEFGK